ncbi:MAG: hypothetical protein LBL99_02890, partial [Holosporaceae bacterium]|jgi:glutamine synthetase|nr:hypothetical protein [Holosporaceae bacterium]
LEENLIPLSFIAALTAGAAEYHSLLTSVISTPGNALRIGGHEAPPNIMSVYLGKALDSLFKAISNKSAEDSYEKKRLNFGLKKLPNLSAHGSDRNRTSPLAFTGNKFEFRAPGSSQAVARPVAMLTAVWALGIDGIIEKIESNRKNGLNDRESALKAIADSYEEGAKIRFEGDAYSKEWREEAERRELAIPKNIVEGIGYSISPKNVEALSSMNIFTKEELEAYEKIRLKALCDTISAEATVLKKMTFGGVLPAIAKQIALEGAAASCLSDADSKKSWSKSISKLNEIRAEITDLVDKLNECDEKIASTKSLREKAEIFVNETIPITEEIRKQNDLAESLIDRDIYPFADYSELLIV